MDAYYFDSGGVLDVEEGAEVVDEVGDGVVAVEEVIDIECEMGGQLYGFGELYLNETVCGLCDYEMDGVIGVEVDVAAALGGIEILHDSGCSIVDIG